MAGSGRRCRPLHRTARPVTLKNDRPYRPRPASLACRKACQL